MAKYSLQPIAMGMFGGVIDYNKLNVLTWKAFGSFKKQLEADGFKEVQSGLYETRNRDEIRSWAKELVSKAKI